MGIGEARGKDSRTGLTGPRRPARSVIVRPANCRVPPDKAPCTRGQVFVNPRLPLVGVTGAVYDRARAWPIRTSPEVDMERGNRESPDRHSSAFGWPARNRVIALEGEAWNAFVDALRAPIAVDPIVKERLVRRASWSRDRD